jgi:hypothetical protein
MKHLLSLDWFKSEKKRELENLIIEGQKLQNNILSKELEAVSKEPQVSLFKKLKLVGDVLTIVLKDGSILIKPNATKDDFEKARKCTYEYEILEIVESPDKGEKKKIDVKGVEFEQIKEAIKGLESLVSNTDFEIRENSVYMKDNKGISIERSLPALLVAEFARISNNNLSVQTEEYQALKKFWLKCCLNSNSQSAEDLYTFLTHHQFKIDKHGNFYAYRNVVSLEGKNNNKELVEFVSNTYVKVKSVWKKNPKNFYVWGKDDGTFIFNKSDGEAQDGISKFLGNLDELYNKLPEKQELNYTDAHTQTFDYKVGSTISMARFDGDDNNNISCSKGFHAASKAYNYSGFGDTSILVIINPMDVLAVPLGEVGKLRTCRWFFASVLSQEERHILDDNDFDVTDLGDKFEEECQRDMQNYVQNSFAEEVKRHTFQLPKITNREINSIVNSLSEMKDLISKRVSEI